MDTIGFLGGGNMAEALIKGVIGAKVYPAENIIVSDISAERLKFLAGQYGVGTAGSNTELADASDILMLCVKPQNMNEVLQEIKDAVRPETLVISIAAGVKTARIAAVLGNVPIVRVMPNTPALISEGASALFFTDRAKPMLRKAETIFASVGKAVVVENEGLIDVVTAVSGSGPAYFFLLIEEMIKAAVESGLAEDVARELILQTAKGAALLAVEADKKDQSPAELRRKVTSPGGTTEAALEIFEQGKFGPLVAAAVKRACERSRELSA